MFRLEKAFAIKIPREELFPAENLMNDPELVEHGKLTAKGLGLFKEKMADIDLSDFERDPDINKLGDLFTVSWIVNYVVGKLDG